GRTTEGFTGGISISSYSPISSSSASDDKDPPHRSQWVGMWSRNSSGLSASRRLCGSGPGFAPPGRAFSRFFFLSVEGGLDEVRDVYPAAEAAAPDQSPRPCSDAANQSDPS